MEYPLFKQSCFLQRFPGKGGWTYAEIPGVVSDPDAPFGWVCVKGSIDGFAFEQYRLMPMGQGRLFLPVKAAIRKQIGKKAGDRVMITLYPDTIRVDVPGELDVCLADEPLAQGRFAALPNNQKKEWLQWIYGAQKENTRVARIATAIDHLLRGTVPWQQKEKG